MSIRTIIVAILALICGVSAAITFNLYRKPQVVEAKVETVDVVIAKVEIARGRKLDNEMMTMRAWPKELVPPGAITDLEEAKERLTKTTLYADEPILTSKLADEKGGGVDSLIPMGMRAKTILTPNDETIIAGLIVPGNRVDIVLTTGGGQDGKSTTLMQAKEIFAIGNQIEVTEQNGETRQMRSVTLLLTPQEAQDLSLAGAQGTLSLLLRRGDDLTTAPTEPSRIQNLKVQAGEVDREAIAKLNQGIQNLFDGVKSAVTKMRERKEDESVSLKQPTIPTQRSTIRTIKGSSAGRVEIIGTKRPPQQTGEATDQATL